ncbi:hypothetical protein BLS_009014 [Venturia inaequalis]|uniref:Chromosome segregation in meiosis protein n=1 Tax=Venturia inaequalis TaxID=5025 RepID=A0A8H3ZAF7_VENIN|nr:hypothetical protein BLS_009014 [Venturia inaequalis]
MARPETTEEPPRDDLDALFDAASMDEMFNSNSAGNNTREPDRDRNGGHRRAEAQADEEIRITKKRQPVAKLDDTRINIIQFSDVAQLLRTYQLWLDDLYPRAKFADGLAMIEKLGHSKRMQVTRKTWIDESKPKASIEEGDAEHEPLHATSNSGSPANATGVKHREHNSAEACLRPSTEMYDLGVTLLQRTNGVGPSAGSSIVDGGGPNDDELDDLLAEDPELNLPLNGSLDERPTSQGSDRPESQPVQSFEDDEEALREMDMW